MPGFIFKPTRRELQENLRESASRSSMPNVRGRVRTTEEAHDIERRLAREDGGFETDARPIAVDANAPESKQARIEIAQRVGSKDPEKDERWM